MRSKAYSPILTLLAVFLLAACPDPSDANPESPGGEAVTEEMVAEAVDLLLDCYGDADIRALESVAGSGVAHDPASDTWTFDGFDISALACNGAGYLALDGSVSPSAAGTSHDFDLTLTSAEGAYRIEFTYTLPGAIVIVVGPMPENLTVTVNGTEYTIPYPVPSVPEGIPEDCGINSDSSSSTTIHLLRWPDNENPPVGPSDVQSGTASKDELFSVSSVVDDYTYHGHTYEYDLIAESDVNSGGEGSGTLTVRTGLDGEGVKFPTWDGVYQVYANTFHKVYFTARSDNPDTTRINVSFHMQASGGLSFAKNDYAAAFASLRAKGWLSRMGWAMSELGGREWKVTEVLETFEGYGVTGYTDHPGSHSTGIFDGDIGSAYDTEGSISGDSTLSCSVTPETEMMCLELSLFARSVVEFIGLNLDFKGSGEAECTNGRMTYTYSAEDPDHPGANVTVDFYIPDF